MQAEDRAAFEKILAELFGAIDKPLGEATREAFWKGLAKMSLLEFSRCRDLLLDELSQGEAPKKFAVPDIWSAKKRLRTPAPTASQSDGWTGDVWDIAANNHLLAYVMRVALAHRKLARDETLTLVAFKNRWSELMRVAADGQDGVPPIEQMATWRECMRMAEEAMLAELAA